MASQVVSQQVARAQRPACTVDVKKASSVSTFCALSPCTLPPLSSLRASRACRSASLRCSSCHFDGSSTGRGTGRALNGGAAAPCASAAMRASALDLSEGERRRERAGEQVCAAQASPSTHT
eukprot:5656068-Pleurochrysis_carterae.AAC.2